MLNLFKDKEKILLSMIFKSLTIVLNNYNTSINNILEENKKLDNLYTLLNDKLKN
jgi:hypothetical protein